ncbi:MAG: hypothetical protein C0418_01030 [Coriobacteriaceae bacterium]|nr:hypothetical protein [Coriobacteriaceae bacterium]
MPRTRVGGTVVRTQPLWARVDANRVKLSVFVGLFVAGSALLLTLALVAVPGYLLAWGAGQIELADAAEWYARMPLVIGGAFLVMLAVGAIIAAVQLSNAEDWVRARLKGRDVAEGEAPRFASTVHDMSLAAGLPEPPRIVVLDSPSVNAFAVGTTRRRPLIGVTRGLLDALTEGEERAVVAMLTARIAAGDIMFGTALAALMGPLKAIRDSRKAPEVAKEACCSSGGCSGADLDGCADGCSGCGDVGGCIGDLDSDSASGCASVAVVVLFLLLVAALTYAAVMTAAWIVTLWGRALHRTSYEKADAEGMLLLKEPAPMLTALRKAVVSENRILEGDPSYDGIFYAPTSGRPQVERLEKHRFRRLAEVLGTEGAVELLERPPADPPRGSPPKQ